jgi:O-antigen/teichoic acid export membrane protein
MVSIRKWITVPDEVNYLPSLIKYAAPLGLSAVMMSVLPVGERWITARLLSVEEVGLYAAGSKIAILVAFMAEAFQSAWTPFAHANYREQTARSVFSRALILFSTLVLGLVFVLASVAVPLIEILVSERYVRGAVVVFPVALGLAILSIGQIIEVSLGIGMKPRLVMYGSFARMSVFFALVFVLAPIFGMQGVALSALLGCVTQTVLIANFVQRSTTKIWDLSELFPLITTATLGATCLALTKYHYGLGTEIYIASTSAAIIGLVGWWSYRRIAKK